MANIHTNSFPIRLLRFCHLLLHFFAGLFIAGLLFPIYSTQQRKRAIMRWGEKLLSILHVDVEVRGDLSILDTTGCIIAANHISWLDIFLIQSICPARFVAKSEIRNWPVAGWLCAKTGTLFIERERRHHTAKINQVMIDAIQNGDFIGLFPEGSTSLGGQLKKLHSSLFEAAVESKTLVIPTAIRYLDSNRKRSEIPAYVDDMSFLTSVRRIIATPKLHAILDFSPPVTTAGKHRREVTAETADAIRKVVEV